MIGIDEGEDFPVVRGDVPTVTGAQMARVDELAVDEYGIGLLQMMENAGGALARVVRSRVRRGTGAAVLAGGGGNGGGALVCARRLVGFGMEPTVILDRPVGDLVGAAAHQAATLGAMGVPFAQDPDAAHGEVIVDGLVGYGLRAAPRGRTAELIAWTRSAQRPVISLDVPSGVDATTGHGHIPHIEPAVIVTLALPKAGLLSGGETKLLLADIGIPAALYRRHLGLEVGALFEDGDIVDLDGANLLGSE